LWLGLALIVAASVVLLLSDPAFKTSAGNKTAAAGRTLKVALVNFSSTVTLEEGQKGVIDGLAEDGFVDGQNIKLTRFNAETDRATAVAIAKDVVSRDFDLILTVSTAMLQAVANANKDTRRTHVFAITTDPWGAGIGVSRENPSVHPLYMTGYGSLQPVASLFRLAREAKPDLKRVGVVWNPSEPNSEASTVMARAICKELGIELVEVTVDSSAGVAEAANAVLARNVQAIWAGGDVTVAVAFESVVAAARSRRVPVFTNMPSDVRKGALFALGADYHEVGRVSGQLAARVLRGASPAEIPVENLLPEQLAINRTALDRLEPAWTIPEPWLSRAEIIVDKKGIQTKSRPPTARPAQNKTYRIAIVYFAPNATVAGTITGLKKKLSERGFRAGKNLEIREDHAQGDISLIPQILKKHDESDADLIVTLTTPCLSAAAAVVKNKPVVFTEVYDPLAAGAGESMDSHLPNVTGVGSFPPVETMLASMRQIAPRLQAVGTVYNSAEANSRKVIEVARELFRRQGLRLEEAAVAGSSEVLQAAQVLTQKNIDVLWEFGDNTVNEGLEGMVKAADDAGLPFVTADVNSIDRGPVLAVGISFYESGVAAGDLVARVLAGEKPAGIPFVELAVARQAVNLSVARRLRREIPTALLKQCDQFVGVRERYGRPARVALVQLVEDPTLDAASDGVVAGLTAAGLKAGVDCDLQKYNAQGEISQLPLILANIKNQQVDVVITSTTPAMIAAAQAIRDIPIVFTVASYPPTVDVYAEGQRQKNLVGVYDDPPLAELIELARKRETSIQKIGIVWNPAEPNSEISVKKLRRICAEQGLTLIERNAASVTELPDATAAVCQAGAQILVTSADNVASSGFPALVSTTRKYHVPIYATDPDMVRRGAAGAVGDDYFDWGQQTGRLAAKVLAGVPPAELPLEKTATQRTAVAENAQ
jgi:ABC-type uncharacterized transport system substrate-binding protein